VSLSSNYSNSFLSTPVAQTPALALFGHLEQQLKDAMNKKETPTIYHKPEFKKIQEQPWEDYDDDDNQVYKDLNAQQLERISEYIPPPPETETLPDENPGDLSAIRKPTTKKMSFNKQLSSKNPSSENLNRLSPKNDVEQLTNLKKKMRKKKRQVKSRLQDHSRSPELPNSNLMDEQARLEAEMRRKLMEERSRLKNMFKDNLK
jgi:hypothetical protein